LSQPVLRELVIEALALAQYAPLNSNIRPWHMVFASGTTRDRLVAALLDEAQRRPPNRRWPALSACTGISVRRTPSAWGCSCKHCCWP
jgi:nitroreductase